MYAELVEYIVKALVEQAEMVSVREAQGSRGVVLEVTVAQSDIGRVIGREGRIINAIRALLEALATSHGQQVSLELL